MEIKCALERALTIKIPVLVRAAGRMYEDAGGAGAEESLAIARVWQRVEA